MSKQNKLPATDSIQKLAKFWDTHDLTDSEDELEEVTQPVFARARPLSLRLAAGEARAIEKLAHAKGVSREELVRQWVRQRLTRQKNAGVARRSA